MKKQKEVSGFLLSGSPPGALALMYGSSKEFATVLCYIKVKTYKGKEKTNIVKVSKSWIKNRKLHQKYVKLSHTHLQTLVFKIKNGSVKCSPYKDHVLYAKVKIQGFAEWNRWSKMRLYINVTRSVQGAGRVSGTNSLHQHIKAAISCTIFKGEST